MLRRLLWLAPLVLVALSCCAQSNDVSFSVGGLFSPDSVTVNTSCAAVIGGPPCSGVTHTSTRVAYEGVLAHRLLNARVVSLHLELPVLGTPQRGVTIATFNGASYSSVFFTPGLRLKFALPGLSPFVSVGGGFSRFSIKGGNSGDTLGALQVGGGVDLGTPVPHIALRGEIREFYTGQFGFTGNKQNLFVGGGIVLRF